MHRILSTVWFVVFVSLTAPSYAAEPEFKVWLVTESRTYEREELVAVTPSVGMPVFRSRVSINRVTVALEGVHITGEWETHTSRARAKDFPPGTGVQTATRRKQLLLKHADGSVVKARIVRPVKPEENEDVAERD
jgi:hypothetical protein